MDRIQELLDKGIANLTAEELAEYRDLSAAEIIERAKDPTDENITIMKTLRDARVEAVEALTAIEAAEAERAAEAAALVAEVTAEPVVAETVPDPTPDPDPAEDEPVVEEPVLTPVPDAPTPEAVAAAAPVIDRSKAAAEARRGKVVPIRQADDGAITAAGEVRGFAAGQQISREQVGEILSDKIKATEGSRSGGKFYVARASAEFGDDRTLGSDKFANQRKIDAVMGREVLVAAGGLCAPVPVRYELFGNGSTDRPLRDSLPRFNADRGGVQFVEPPLLTALAGAVDTITEAEDTSGATKPCLTVVCGDTVEVKVDAVTKCLQIGEYDYRYFREQYDRWLNLAETQHSREAEMNLWERMCTLGTAVSGGTDTLGAIRELLPWLARAGAQMRSRHRMDDDATLRFAAPAWLLRLLQADMIRSVPGDSTVGITTQQINAFIRNLNIEPVWAKESNFVGDVNGAFGAQPAGAILGWPDAVEVMLYAEGTFIFLDGGTLDIGIYRDNDLIVANNLRTFSETFENVAMVGTEALCATLDICPSGGSSAAITFSCPQTGS